MGFILRLGSYVFHPLLLPTIGWLIYIATQPIHQWDVLVSLSYKDFLLFTILIPALVWSYLKLRKKISDWDVTETKQRVTPLLLYAVCLVTVLVLGKLDYMLPLKAFIYGILTSVITALLLVLLKVKASLHQMAISGLLVFVMCLSIYFRLNLLLYIIVLILANGWVASSRLYLNRHTPAELLLGFIIGSTPQLYLVTYWL